MKASRALRLAGMVALVPALSACENSATAYMVDTNQHAVVLAREQAYFWSDEVDQFVIVSRLPHCQRKVRIHPGSVNMAEMEVYEAGDRLWALRQGQRWYLASTEVCQVQDWNSPGGQGALVGSFRMQDGTPTFVAVQR